MPSAELLRQKYPEYKIVSEPDPGCQCGGTGERKYTRTGMELPCLCVCLSAPDKPSEEYRGSLCRMIGNSARSILNQLLDEK